MASMSWAERCCLQTAACCPSAPPPPPAGPAAFTPSLALMRVGDCRPGWEVGKQRDEPEVTGCLTSSLDPGGCFFFLVVPALVSVSGALRLGSSLTGPTVLAAMAEPVFPHHSTSYLCLVFYIRALM